MSAECLFCRIARKEVEADIVAEGEEWVAFRDISPQAPTHLLVIPRDHVAGVADLEVEHRSSAGALLLAARRVAEEEGIAGSGFRVVANTGRDAGQEVPHLHLHVLGGRALGWPPG